MRVLRAFVLVVGLVAIGGAIAVAGRLLLPEIALPIPSLTPVALPSTRPTPTAMPSPTPDYRAAIQSMRVRISDATRTLLMSMSRNRTQAAYVTSPEFATALTAINEAREEVRRLFPQSGALGQAREQYLLALELTLATHFIWPGGDGGAHYSAALDAANAAWRRADDRLP